MSLPLVHGLSARRTFCVAAVMAVVLALIGYLGQPRMEEVRAAPPLFVTPTALAERPAGPRYDVAVAAWVTKARHHIAGYIDLHGGAATHHLIAALTAPRSLPKVAHAGFTYGPAMGELELGTVFIGRSIRTALRPAPLPGASDQP